MSLTIINNYRLITHNAAKTLHITDHYGIKKGAPANFIALDTENWYDALNRSALVLKNVRGGKILTEGTPASVITNF